MRDHMIVVRHIDDEQHDVVMLTMDLNQDGSVWTGTCLELGTSTYADTLDTLRSELADAILLQLNEVERLGFTEEYLEEQGVRVLKFPPPPVESSERWGELVGAGAF